MIYFPGFSAVSMHPKYAISVRALIEATQKPVLQAALQKVRMLDAYASFLFTPEKEVPVRAISLSSDQCQLGGRTNMGKVKLLFLPISMQLFLTLYCPSVLQLINLILEFL